MNGFIHRLRTAALAFCFAIFCLAAPAQTLQDGRVTILYDPADAALARHSMEIVEEALREFDARLPAGDAPVTVALCRTHAEFRRYAGQFALTGVGGVAEAHSGTIAVKTPRIQPSGADYDGILRHEILHLLLARNYNTAVMPRWLNEGLTMILSGEIRVDDRFLAGYMSVRGSLIPYNELPLVLEAAEYDGRLGEAYAQSLSMTEFLMKRLGEDRFWALLRSLDSKDFPAALREETGQTLFQWFDAWQQSLWKVALVFSLVSGFSAFQLMAVLVFIAYWRRRRRNRALLQRWEEEEADEPFLFAYQLEGREEPHPWEEEDEDRL